MSSAPYRVVQWATGNIGLRSLRAVIDHPDLELVGLYVYSDAKVGKDAGDLCGLPPVGVVATRDIDEILALHPDCVIYMGDRMDADVIVPSARVGCECCVDAQRIPPSGRSRSRNPVKTGGRLCPRALDTVQHRFEPWLHH